MNHTIAEIINQMEREMPYRLPVGIVPYIKEAMEVYAKQEAKSFANWLSNQVIEGRTMKKLWDDYESQFTTVKQ